MKTNSPRCSENVLRVISAVLFAAIFGAVAAASAATSAPILISEGASTRGIAVESVTLKDGPFALTSTVKFSNDTRTRIAIFAMKIIVGESGWQAKLDANKQMFLNEWVNCSGFKDVFDAKTNAEYVDALFANAGITPQVSERQGLISGLDTHAETRATVLLRVAENSEFKEKISNKAFVLAEYFGYLRRNAYDRPDSNLNGYNFWLNKLNQFNGNFVEAEMVKAFIASAEYRHRFGP
jgi:hypothetical protein